MEAAFFKFVRLNMAYGYATKKVSYFNPHSCQTRHAIHTSIIGRQYNLLISHSHERYRSAGFVSLLQNKIAPFTFTIHAHEYEKM